MEYSQSSELMYKGLVVLFDDDRIRYGCQIVYPGFGKKGQKKLKAAHVAALGVGGLGRTASIYLAYAGIGHITIVYSDSVELSNFNRQILHWEQDIKERKTASAARKLGSINSSIKITPVKNDDEIKVLIATGGG